MRPAHLLYRPGAGAALVCTYFDENFLNLVPAAHVEGLSSCLDYYQNVGDPFSKELIDRYDTLYPGNAKFTAGSACSGIGSSGSLGGAWRPEGLPGSDARLGRCDPAEAL